MRPVRDPAGGDAMHPSTHAADLAAEMAELVRAAIPLLPAPVPAGLADDLTTAAADLRQGDDASTAVARLPATVRGTLAAVNRGADGRTLLAAVQRFAATAREDRRIARTALAYPVIVALLAGLGIAWLAMRSASDLADLEVSYAGPIRGVPSGGILTRSLGLPLLAGLSTLAATAAGWSWYVRRRWQPAGAAAALACHARAALIAAGCAADDEPRIVDEICGGTAADRGPEGAPLPLVAHAASFQDPVERAEALRAAARFYEAEADRRRENRRRLLPIMGIVAAGFIVLLYGLALFGPLAETLDTMAVNPPGPAGRRAAP